MDKLRQQLAELRDWLQSYSGKLAALAAMLSAILTAIPTDAAFAAIGVLPEGPPRIALAVGMFAIVWLLPKAAAKKDGADGQ